MDHHDSDFRSLAHGQQLRLLDELAQAAASRFGIDVERCELLQYERNAVYRLTARAGASFALRVSAEDGYSAAEQTSELFWLRALRADGQRVPEPVPGPDGEPLLELGTPRLPARACVLFRWLEGEQPSAAVSELQIAALGAATQRLHAHSRMFQPPPGFTRPSLDFASALGDGPRRPALPAHRRGLFARLAERWAAELGELEGERACLLHGDLHRDNLLLQARRVGFIDFEDCGWGHPLFDVVSLLDSLRRRVLAPRDYPRARAALLEAYRPGMSQDRELTRPLRAFKALRDAITLRFIESSPSESVQSWAEPRVAQLLQHLSDYLDGGPARI